MEIETAQQDLRRAFVGGGPGVLISGLVWLAAALVVARAGVSTGFATLFFGGMLIFPLAALVTQRILGRAPAAATNVLARVALESTIAMVGGLLLAWLFVRLAPALAFPAAAIVVGTRYAVFRTVYGNATYWLLGGVIAGIGALAVYLPVPEPALVPLAVAIGELVFGAVLTIGASR